LTHLNLRDIFDMDMNNEIAQGLAEFLAQKIAGTLRPPEPKKKNPNLEFQIEHKGNVTNEQLRTWTGEYFQEKGQTVRLDEHLMSQVRIDNKLKMLSISNLSRVRLVTGSFV
jgi:hypothetical protein